MQERELLGALIARGLVREGDLERARRTFPGLSPVEALVRARLVAPAALAALAGGSSSSARDPLPAHATEARQAAPGERAIGPWRLERELGRGTQGVVWLARHPAGGPPVALKLLKLTQLDDETRARFEREAEVGRALDHPGIVRVLDAGTHCGRPWYAMEYVPGPTLRDRLRAGGALEPRAAVELALALSRALASAHARGVVHRDLKPGNVILAEGSGQPRIADFGLAKWVDRATLTRTGDVLGTPAYMPLEQLDDSKRADDRADVWALGVILYECLTGRRPFSAPSPTALVALLRGGAPAAPPSSLRPGLDPGLDALCARALARAPAARPDAASFAAGLEAWLVRPGPGARAAEPADPGPAKRPRRGSLPALGAALLGLLALAASLGGRGGRPPATTPAPAVAGSPAPAVAPAAGAVASDDLQAVRRELAGAGPWRVEVERRARTELARLGAQPALQAELRLDLARWLAWRGRVQEVLDLLEDQDPATDELRDRQAILVAWCHLLAGDLGRAHVGPGVEALLAGCGETPPVQATRALVAAYVPQAPDDPRAPRLVRFALELSHDDPEVAVVQAYLLMARGERAPPGLAEALERQPDDPRAAQALAAIRIAEGDLERGHEALHRSHDLLEGRVQLLVGLGALGELCQRAGHAESFQGLLERALAAHAGPAVRLERLHLRWRGGDETGARRDLVGLLDELDSFVPCGRKRLHEGEPLVAWIDHSLGMHPRGGLSAWEPVPPWTRQDGDRLEARAAAAALPARPALLRALRAATVGDPPEQVASALAEAGAAAPGDPGLALEAARLSVRRDLDGAAQAVARARALNPAHEAELELLRGVGLLRDGLLTEGHEVLRGLARREPAGQFGLCAAAELALLAGEEHQALAAAEAALALDPNSLPATVARTAALLVLDPRAADDAVTRAIHERWGWEEARLAGLGAEVAGRAVRFSVSILDRRTRAEVAILNARANLVGGLTRGVWWAELMARYMGLLAPYMLSFEQGREISRQTLARARERGPERAGLLLAEGLVAITPHLLQAAPARPAEPCLDLWRRALRAEPGLALPAAYADRFAREHPRHALLVAWRRLEEPRPPLAGWLAAELRAGR